LKMRLTVPERFKVQYVVIFVFLVFAAQELEGTDAVFAVLTAAYTLLWATAYNISGGIRYPSGAFIFFNGFLNAIIGLTFKVFLLQPGESHLKAPRSTMFTYCVGMAVILGAAFICRGLRPSRGFLPKIESVDAYRRAAIICLVGGFVITLLSLVGSSNAVISILRQINKLPQMAIMLGTIYEIRSSKGKRSINWIVVGGITIILATVLVSFGKTGMLLGAAAYVIAAVLEGYDFPIKQIFIGVLGFAFFSYYLVPYSQYVRNLRATTAADNAQLALFYLSNLNETRRLYETDIAEVDVNEEPHLYDQREGYMDRQVILPADDTLISYTNEGHVFGLTPTIVVYANLVPHFIWKNKPYLNIGNAYAHEIGGILVEEDETTGIAFSATADAYHQEGWLGVLLLLPIDVFLFFIIMDSVVGSAKWAPWALIPILDLTTIAPEGGLNSLVYEFTFGLSGIVLLVVVINRVVPFFLQNFSQSKFSQVRSAPTLLVSPVSANPAEPPAFSR